jgi:hypothetical protein
MNDRIDHKQLELNGLFWDQIAYLSQIRTIKATPELIELTQKVVELAHKLQSGK